MNLENSYNLIVLGAGPSGYTSAIRAAQLGITNIAVIEKDEPGGTCLNWGCIPTKSLIEISNQLNSLKDISFIKNKSENTSVDFQKVFDISRKSTNILSRGVAYLLKKNGITLIKGKYKFHSKNELIDESGNIIKGKNIVIAVGAHPKELPFCKLNGKNIISSKEALNFKELPKSILIIGSGVIGIEFAYIWNSFGVDITVFEVMDNILPMEDLECSSFIKKSFEKKGVKIFTGVNINSVYEDGEFLKVSFNIQKGEEKFLHFDKILVAIGRQPDTKDLNLETCGIDILKNGAVKIDDNFETSVKGVYAIGDVIDTIQLAHAGSKEGEMVAEKIAHGNINENYNLNEIPMCIYCEPQLGRFGYTEKELEQKNILFKKIIYPYRANGKAVSLGKSDGFIKILFVENTKELLGVHIVGKDATELIHQFLIIKKFNISLKDAGKMIFAHPTLSELVIESLKALYGEAINF